MSKPMNVIFDFGAVLLRWRPRVLLRGCLPHLAGDDAAADALAARIFQGFRGDWAQFDRGAVGVDELVQRISQRTGLAAADVRAVVDAVPAELQPMTDSLALLPELAARGHRLLFLSNMPAPYADYIEATHTGLMRHFEGGVFSGRSGLIKPEPAIFQLVEERHGAAASRNLFIDDHPANVKAAQAQGWQAVLFTDAAQARGALQGLGLI